MVKPRYDLIIEDVQPKILFQPSKVHVFHAEPKQPEPQEEPVKNVTPKPKRQIKPKVKSLYAMHKDKKYTKADVQYEAYRQCGCQDDYDRLVVNMVLAAKLDNL